MSDKTLILQFGRASIWVGAPDPEAFPFFGAVLNLRAGISPADEAKVRARAVVHGASYMHAPIGDVKECRDKMLALLPSALTFLMTAWNSNRRILVHCRKGASRSPTVVAVFLMELHQRNHRHNPTEPLLMGATEYGLAQAALYFLKQRRSVVHPNRGFREVLRIWSGQSPWPQGLVIDMTGASDDDE